MRIRNKRTSVRARDWWGDAQRESLHEPPPPPAIKLILPALASHSDNTHPIFDIAPSTYLENQNETQRI